MSITNQFFFFRKFLEDRCPFFLGPLIPLFLVMSALGFRTNSALGETIRTKNYPFNQQMLASKLLPIYNRECNVGLSTCPKISPISLLLTIL